MQFRVLPKGRSKNSMLLFVAGLGFRFHYIPTADKYSKSGQQLINRSQTESERAARSPSAQTGRKEGSSYSDTDPRERSVSRSRGSCRIAARASTRKYSEPRRQNSDNFSTLRSENMGERAIEFRINNALLLNSARVLILLLPSFYWTAIAPNRRAPYILFRHSFYNSFHIKHGKNSPVVALALAQIQQTFNGIATTCF